MDRLACVSLPALPLQLLLRRHPEWTIHPVAVIAEDRPHAFICYVNASAHKAGVRPGLHYAAGCSLTADLRAGVVPPAEIDEAVEVIMKRLRHFTPEIESSAEEPGVFWLNGTGLTRLYPSYEVWVRLIASDLNRMSFRATVVVGFTRFGTYAVAKAQNGTVVLNDPVDERAAVRQVQLECLEIDPDLRDTLAKLGVTTVGAFLALPAGGLLARFGEAAYRLHRMASGELWTPLQPLKPQESIRQRLLLDDPETEAMRLLFRLKGLLHPLLKALAVRGEALAGLTLRLRLDGGEWCEKRICPAAPTLDPAQILDLVRLKLEHATFLRPPHPRPLPHPEGTRGARGIKKYFLSPTGGEEKGEGVIAAGVIEMELMATGVQALAEQYRLIVERPRRDLEAANRALARIRATFGDEAVGRVRLIDAHLPEASFRWESLKQGLGNRRQGSRSESAIGRRNLVRRIFAKPVPLHLPPGSTLHGPYITSGGWWGRDLSACGHAQAGTHRDYYFVETHHGELLWVYYDPNRSHWYLHGRVE